MDGAEFNIQPAQRAFQKPIIHMEPWLISAKLRTFKL